MADSFAMSFSVNADTLGDRYAVSQGRIVGVSHLLGRKLPKLANTRSEGAMPLTEQFFQEQSVDSILPQLGSLVRYDSTSSATTASGIVSVGGKSKAVRGEFSVAELRRITHRPPGAHQMSSILGSPARDLAGTSWRSAECSPKRRASASLRLSSDFSDGARDSSELVSPSKLDRMKDFQDILSQRNKRKSILRQSCETKVVSKGEGGEDAESDDGAASCSQGLAVQLPTGEVDTDDEGSCLMPSASAGVMVSLLAKQISAQRRVNTQKKKGSKGRNPFVEYEDRELRLQLERRWLQDDPAYMEERTQGLRHNTVQTLLDTCATEPGGATLSSGTKRCGRPRRSCGLEEQASPFPEAPRPAPASVLQKDRWKQCVSCQGKGMRSNFSCSKCEGHGGAWLKAKQSTGPQLKALQNKLNDSGRRTDIRRTVSNALFGLGRQSPITKQCSAGMGSELRGLFKGTTQEP